MSEYTGAKWSWENTWSDFERRFPFPYHENVQTRPGHLDSELRCCAPVAARHVRRKVQANGGQTGLLMSQVPWDSRHLHHRRRVGEARAIRRYVLASSHHVLVYSAHFHFTFSLSVSPPLFAPITIVPSLSPSHVARFGYCTPQSRPPKCAVEWKFSFSLLLSHNQPRR